MRSTLTQLSLQRPKTVLWMTLLLTAILGAFIPFIQVDTDPENMLPDSQPDRVLHNALKERFSLYDNIVVGMVNEGGIYTHQSLTNIMALTDHIRTIDGVIEKDLMSLSTVDNIEQAGPGTIRFDWLLNKLPDSDAERESLADSVRRLPLLNNTLVSADEKAAAIYVPIVDKHESYRIAEDIREFTDTLPGNDQFHITGLPVAEDTFGTEMFIQMAISAPLAALTIFLLMWFFFRSMAVVTSPMLMAMAVVISTMGLMIGLGYTVHIMSSMIPIFLMPIAVVDSVHILSEFSDRYRPGDDPKVVMRQVLEHLFTPMLYTSLTSGIGFASLALAPIPPVQVFGLFIAFGIALAFLLTVTFIPAYIVSLSPEKLEKLALAHHGMEARSRTHDGRLSQGLFKLGQGAFRNSRMILVGAAVLSVVSVVGLSRIEINDNPVRWFEEQHDIRIADRTLNSHFAGTYNVFLVLTQDSQKSAIESLQSLVSDKRDVPPSWSKFIAGLPVDIDINGLVNRLDEEAFTAAESEQSFWSDLLANLEARRSQSLFFQQPETLHYIASLQHYLAQSGLVGKSNSLADLVKTVNRELHGGETNFDSIPDSAAGVAQTILSFQGSHRPDDLWHMVTPDYRSAALWLQLTSGDNQDMVRVLEVVDAFTSQHPLPEGLKIEWGGLTYINVVWQQAMVSGMLDSLIGSFVTVFIVMVVLFRSVVFGALAMIPLSLTILFIYGVIGWVGKDYDMPIAVLSALTLGLSVDFAIHFLERARASWKAHKSWDRLSSDLFGEPARAIGRNALVIALGFLPLLLAPLVPYKTVGFFLAAIMLASCGATLMLLPALMQLFKNGLFSR